MHLLTQLRPRVGDMSLDHPARSGDGLLHPAPGFRGELFQPLAGLLQHLVGAGREVFNMRPGVPGDLLGPLHGPVQRALGGLRRRLDAADHLGVVFLEVLLRPRRGFEDVAARGRPQFIETRLLHRPGLADGILLHVEEGVEMLRVLLLYHPDCADDFLRDGLGLFDVFHGGAQALQLLFECGEGRLGFRVHNASGICC